MGYAKLYIAGLVQSLLRAQQCGVPNNSLHPGTEQLASTPCPEKEEEAEAQREEKKSSWTGEWKCSGPNPSELFFPFDFERADKFLL